MILKKLLQSSILAVTLLILSPIALTEDLSIGVEWSDYYPIYATQDSKYKGFARDLLDAFAKESNHTINYQPLSVRRITNDYLKGDFDFKFPDNAAWSSDQKKGKPIVYSDPVMEYIDGVMVLTRNLGLGKEKLKSLGYLHGFTPFIYLDDINAGKIDTIKTGSMKHLFKMLKSGRIDGVYINITVAEYYLRNSPYGKNLAKFDNVLPYEAGEYRLSSFTQPGVIAEFNNFLVRKSKLIEKLEGKYELN